MIETKYQLRHLDEMFARRYCPPESWEYIGRRVSGISHDLGDYYAADVTALAMWFDSALWLSADKQTSFLSVPTDKFQYWFYKKFLEFVDDITHNNWHPRTYNVTFIQSKYADRHTLTTTLNNLPVFLYQPEKNTYVGRGSEAFACFCFLWLDNLMLSKVVNDVLHSSLDEYLLNTLPNLWLNRTLPT